MATKVLLVDDHEIMREGLSAYDACDCAISRTLTDDAEMLKAIDNIVRLYFGSLTGDGHDETA